MTSATGRRLKVLSWNMNQSATSWAYLAQLARRYRLDVALLQEARPPTEPAGFECEPDVDDRARWRISVPVGLNRRYCSAVVCFDPRLGFQPLRPTPLNETPPGGLAASHPGQFAVGTVTRPGYRPVTVVSLYGLWDTMADSGDIYAYASLHRALSDLTPLLQARQARVILAGDLNVWHGYGGAPWEDRFRCVFERLSSQGLQLVGPFRADAEPTLDHCPCGPRLDCRHVTTFKFRRNPLNRPYQNDFVFASEPLSGAATVRTVDHPDVWLHSDHVPVIAEFSIDPEET